MSGRQATTRRKRAPKPSTPQRLRNGALHHLKRYPATSSGRLRTILARRVRRSERLHQTDTAALLGDVEAIISDFTERGYLNDRLLADRVIRSRRGQGKGWHAVRAALFKKLIPPDVENAAIAAAKDAERESATMDPDLRAAWVFAERKRIGPFKPEGRRDRWKKDMGRMARAGHGYGVAREVIDADEIPDLL